MSELPDRVGRAFRDHGSFAPAGEAVWTVTTTPFEARVAASPDTEGRIDYRVTVRVPVLSAVTNDEVAPVVEDGWAETFELRVVDVGGVTRAERDPEPTVEREDDELVVRVAFADLDPRRAVDDAVALVDFVEGTYVQGVIPGYDYREPVTSLLGRARQMGGSGSEPADGAGGGTDAGTGGDGGTHGR
jgi:hypothetical protein